MNLLVNIGHQNNRLPVQLYTFRELVIRLFDEGFNEISELLQFSTCG